MQRTQHFFLNVIFFLQVLLLFLFLFEDRLSLPVWLEVVGRLHPAMLHLPIGMMAFSVVLVFMQRQFKKKVFKKITLMVLLLTSLTASVTALFGIFLAKQGDYGLEALSQHRNGGIVLSVMCYFLLLAFVYSKKSQITYGVGILTIAAMFFAGHTGSVLTHGENFVLAPLTKSSTNRGGTEGSAFQAVIYPILEKKCTSCHNRTKAKGKFVMTSMSEFLNGGKHGKEWVAGNPKESRIIEYIHLPLADDNHMPPDGKPQLSRQEIKLLEFWIAAGADVEKKLAELPDVDSFKIMGTAALALTKPGSSEEKTYSFSGASEETINRMNTPFRSVFPLYQKSPALQADFFIKESFKSTSLEELLEVESQLVVLNLSKMPVTDNDLKIIGTFSNLEKLNLNFSKISGSGLSSLQSLRNLTSLSLAGTAVTAESLAPVLAISSLRELFIWNTKITEVGKAKLVTQYPNITIVTSQFRDDKILQLGKPLLVNEGITIKKDESVTLRHSMPGVTIRYTLDGTNPDSVRSSPYDKPVTLTATSTVKAIACRPGWYCSEVYETTCFVEGLKPTRVELLTKPDKQYPGEGEKSLVDGRKGFIENFKDPSWLGYQNDLLASAFDFGSNPPVLHSIVISYGKSVGSHIFPPETVEVWAGSDSREATLIQSMKIAQPVAYDPAQLVALVIPLKATHYSYYKLIVKPVKKLPAWHSGKGKKGWVFVDEIFFY